MAPARTKKLHGDCRAHSHLVPSQRLNQRPINHLKRPAWFVEAPASGKTAEELLVNPGAAEVASTKPSPKRRGKATKPAKKVGVPKYSDGGAKTWTGQGKCPSWFVQALEAGKTAENLLIKTV
ncbi:H-NS family nucleoid-associated regulatory protein [Roseateles sp. So40a]|uniref:H-NS histone family protein n=1 Tax=Roseateles sp. So40a TaxID=3400226 RepID=UPI003A8BA221